MRGFGVSAVPRLIMAKNWRASICPRSLSVPLGFAPLLSWNRAGQFQDPSLTEEAIVHNGLHILSVSFKKEALLVSNPFSASTETRVPAQQSYSSVLPSSCPTSSPVHLSPDTEPTSGGKPFSCKKGDQERFQRT